MENTFSELKYFLDLCEGRTYTTLFPLQGLTSLVVSVSLTPISYPSKYLSGMAGVTDPRQGSLHSVIDARARSRILAADSGTGGRDR